ALAGLARAFPMQQRDRLLEEAIHSARNIREEQTRSEALAALAQALPEPQRDGLLNEAVQSAQKVDYPWNRYRALAALIPQLVSVGRVDDGLQIARSIEDKWGRSKVLAGLAKTLPLQQRETVLDEVLVNARVARYDFVDAEWSAVLVDIAPLLTTQHDLEL